MKAFHKRKFRKYIHNLERKGRSEYVCKSSTAVLSIGMKQAQFPNQNTFTAKKRWADRSKRKAHLLNNLGDMRTILRNDVLGHEGFHHRLQQCVPDKVYIRTFFFL